MNVHLVLENRANALVVPSAAIQTGLQGSLFVWVIENDANGKPAAKMQPVKVALAEGQSTILDSGPAPGAKVVVDGADRLRPGQQVVVSAARQRAGQGSGAGHGAAQGEQAPAEGLFKGANKAGQPQTVTGGQPSANPDSNPRQQQ